MTKLQKSLKPLFYFHLKGGLLSLLLAVLSIGGATYVFSEKALISSVKQNLLTNAAFRKERIVALVKQQRHWMKSAAENPALVTSAGQLIATYQEKGGDSNAYRWLRDRFRSEYRVLTHVGGVSDLFLLTPQGELAFSLQPEQHDLGEDLTENGFFGASIFSQLIDRVSAGEEVAISDYGDVAFLGRSVMLMGAPLYAPYSAPGEGPVGILVRPFSIDWLHEMLSDYSGLGETGEVVIGQRERRGEAYGARLISLFRNEDSGQSEACSALMNSRKQQFPMWRAIQKVPGSGWVIDSRCRRIYAAWDWIPELNWGMVVRQAESEVLQPIQQLRQRVLLAVLLSLSLLVWLAQRQARQLAEPIEQLTVAAERNREQQVEFEIESGGLQVREVNLLSLAIQRLVYELRTHEQELESTVERRTQDLKQEKQFIESIIESMEEGMVVANPDGEILRGNTKIRQLLGEDPVGSMLQQLLEQEEGERAAQRLLTATGEHIPVHVTETQLSLEQQHDQQPLRLVLIFDLRERVRAEEQNQYLAFQSGVAEMSGVVLHNIGNMLVGMNDSVYKGRNSLEMLEQILRGLKALQHRQKGVGLGEDELQRALEIVTGTMDELIGPSGLVGEFDFMENGFNRMGEVIQKYRNASSIEKVATRTALLPMLEDAGVLVQGRYQKAEVALTIDCASSVELRIHRNLAIQALVNLLNNALEAVEERRFQESTMQGQVKVLVSTRAGELELLVMDNGCGIEAERQSEIFQMGSSSKKYSGGYGLHTVGNFINSLGGTIHVESEGHNCGTTIRIVIPTSM